MPCPTQWIARRGPDVLPCAVHVAGAIQVVHHLKNSVSDDTLRVIGMDVAHLHWSKMTSLGAYAALHISRHACWYSNLPGYFIADLASLKPWNAVIS